MEREFSRISAGELHSWQSFQPTSPFQTSAMGLHTLVGVAFHSSVRAPLQHEWRSSRHQFLAAHNKYHAITISATRFPPRQSQGRGRCRTQRASATNLQGRRTCDAQWQLSIRQWRLVEHRFTLHQRDSKRKTRRPWSHTPASVWRTCGQLTGFPSR